jgi:hypothetical protein
VHREGPRVGPRKAPESSPLQGARLHWQRGAPRGARPWPLAGAAASCNSPAGVVQWACGEAGIGDEAGEARAVAGRMHEAGVDVRHVGRRGQRRDRYASCIEPPHVVE